MKLLCPDCMAGLAPSAEGRLRCKNHTGEFTVLFTREALPPLVAMPALETSLPMSGDGAPASPGGNAGRFPGMFCVQHPTVPASQRCQACGAYMCATCDFALPGDLHFCPDCATKPQTTLGPRRRKSMIWSYVCAGVGTFGFILSMLVARRGAGPESQQLIGLMFMLLVFVPSVVGMGMGYGAIDRRYVNPPALWAATIWNAVLLGVFLLLCIVGSMQ